MERKIKKGYVEEMQMLKNMKVFRRIAGTWKRFTTEVMSVY